MLEDRPFGKGGPGWVGGAYIEEEESAGGEAELRLEQRGALHSCWRWVGREA